MLKVLRHLLILQMEKMSPKEVNVLNWEFQKASYLNFFLLHLFIFCVRESAWATVHMYRSVGSLQEVVLFSTRMSRSLVWQQAFLATKHLSVLPYF